MDIWSILWPSGIFYGVLVYFKVICYISPVLATNNLPSFSKRRPRLAADAQVESPPAPPQQQKQNKADKINRELLQTFISHQKTKGLRSFLGRRIEDYFYSS
jgi:hypothetical protein